MSATRSGPGEHAKAISPDTRGVLGKVRRFALGTTRTLWQVLGHLLLDGRRESRDAEVFSGIGFYARPRATDRAEAIVVFTGENAASPVVVATRNEDTRSAVAGGLAEDESAMFNSAAIVVVKANGTVEVRLAGGVAVALATLADVQAIRSALDGHSHTYVPGSGTATTTMWRGGMRAITSR